MKFSIKHEMTGRMRVHLSQNRMTYAQADILLYFLQNDKYVTCAKVYERTGDAVISYTGERSYIIQLLQGFCYEKAEVPTGLLEHSGRELNAVYQEKLIGKVLMRYVKKIVLPYPVYTAYITLSSLKYIAKGIQSLWHRKIEVAVLDATAIGVSVLRKDFGTAGSVMFLLGIGELLEEWTHKKSVDDLARTMALNVGKVWLKSDGQEVLVSVNDISAGDEVVVHMGNVIPFDGEVSEGEAMVNQASLTGESLPIRKAEGNYVYAGTVLEEGELTILVKEVGGSSRFEKIVTMIEESEKLKSSLEGKAEHLADRLVPYTLGGTALTYLLTRNTTKALSVLMVDFSCALKLAMPISVLSAIREASLYHMTVKGGKYLEAVAEADTIVFDKTGTLTKAKPSVVEVVSFDGREPDELLRIAACMEEHFPHSMAKAVVQAAECLHHRPRQQAEHDEDERALQIQLLQVEQRREAEIRDHEQHAEHDDHHLADGVVRLTRAVHHHETDDAHDAGADRDHGRVVELEGNIKQQDAHDHCQIRHRGRQRAEEHVAQEFSLDEAFVRLHGQNERRDADGHGAHERELCGAERVGQRGKEREKREEEREDVLNQIQ